MLGLTLSKNFINNLKVGYYSAIKCHCFQAVKDKSEEIEKKEVKLQKIHRLGCEYSGKWQVRFCVSVK